MAPTPSLILVYSSNHPSGGYLHRLRRQGLNYLRHPSRRPLPPHTEQPKARTLDTALQPSAVLEGPPPPPIVPTSTEPVAITPEPSAIPNNQPQGPSPPTDIPGNIVAAVVVVVLILGGLIGLVVGGEMLRRRSRTEGKKASLPPSRSSGRQESKLVKNAVGPPQQPTPMAREGFPYDEKTLTPLTRPPPILSRERQREFSDVWPIRSLSFMSNQWSCPVQAERSPYHSPPMANPPQTTWSEFPLVSPYVVPPRTVLACIPEELEDSQSQSSSDIKAILGVILERSQAKSGSVAESPRTNERKSLHSMLGFLDGFNELGSSAATTEQHGPQDCQVYKRGTRDEDTKSLGSSTPDMTSDGDESSRSSMASLESLQDNERESLGEEVYELRRAQTRSMQMNKGVLLSLSLKNLDDSQNLESHEECRSSRSSSASDAEGALKEFVEQELSLAMLCGNFSAVNLDEFPSPPSVLPMIPSFVSGF